MRGFLQVITEIHGPSVPALHRGKFSPLGGSGLYAVYPSLSNFNYTSESTLRILDANGFA
jgi:hypothetical protein